MSFKDFRIVETIGKGSFASVYKVIRRSDNKVYALKRIKISKMSKKEIADALNEIRFLASIRHRNIVGFLQAFLENNDSELCIIMEFCGCGDLAQKVERYKRKRAHIDEQIIWKYLIQCLKALHHLHDKGICHRDIKVANTFLGEDGSIKIGDMNVSKRLKQGQLQTQIGTPYYMSPEIWNNRPYDSSCDIWSLGCMIYELCTLRPPFTGDSFPALKRAITVGRYSPIPSKFSESLQKIISHMLRLSARERPSADAILKYPEIVSRMHLDDSNTSFAQDENQKQQVLNLINTIKVPQNINKLNCALPKPCYPDVRPNSPSAWTVAEQKHLKKPLPPVPPISLSADSNDGNSAKSSRDEPLSTRVPAPPLAIVEEHYQRRPLLPIKDNFLHPSSRNNSSNHPYHKYAADSSSNKYRQQSQGYQPTLDPIPSTFAPQPPQHNLYAQAAPTALENIQENVKPQIPTGQRAAGNPTRLHQYRGW
eukprot:gene9493-12789_t